MSGLIAEPPVSMTLPGPLVAQGRAIIARLQMAFPPSLFRFKVLPGQLTREIWLSLTQGNQPFLGLGFKGFRKSADPRVLMGIAVWTLICAVRTPGGGAIVGYFGDAQGAGVLSIASVAAAVLQGAPVATGTLTVDGFDNVAADAWGGDSSIIAISMSAPATLYLSDAIGNPGTGIFKQLAETWNVPGPEGGEDIYTSDWENPNVPA